MIYSKKPHATHAAEYFRHRMDMMQTDILLIQEPYFFKGIQGVGDTGGQVEPVRMKQRTLMNV
jgi:hypothetical protein